MVLSFLPPPEPAHLSFLREVSNAFRALSLPSLYEDTEDQNEDREAHTIRRPSNTSSPYAADHETDLRNPPGCYDLHEGSQSVASLSSATTQSWSASTITVSDDVDDVSLVDNVHTKVTIGLSGWRLYIMVICLYLSLFLSTLETTIVSTSLVSIMSSLDGFDQSGWVNTAYLLSFTGFLVITAKFSDILGQKFMLSISLLIFTIFSFASGAAPSILPLIIFRAFQGVGASGIDAMYLIIIQKMVLPEKYPHYVGMISTVFIASNVLGPTLGGAITDHASWRWVFWINVPIGTAALVLVLIALPSGFPFHQQQLTQWRKIWQQYHKQSRNYRIPWPIKFKSKWKLQKLDLLGAFLSLAASILLVFALEQAGNKYSWNSPAIVSTFALSGLLWIAFLYWEKMADVYSKGVIEPIFPWRLTRNRLFMGVLLNAFLVGLPFLSVIINIPQRFQIVNGTSATDAGIRLLPLVLCTPISSVLSALLSTKKKVPYLYLLVVGGTLQLLGVGLMSSLDTLDFGIEQKQYAFQAIMGLGFGFSISAVVMMTPSYVDEKDISVSLGAISQLRVLGGTIGLALCSALLNNQIKSQMGSFSSGQAGNVITSTQAIGTLSPDIQRQVKHVFAEGFRQQMIAMTGVCAAGLLALLLILEKTPRRQL